MKVRGPMETNKLRVMLANHVEAQSYSDAPVHSVQISILTELLAFREGYAPSERLPDLGQWVVIEPRNRDDDDPPMMVVQWVTTPEDVRCFMEDAGDTVEERVWYVECLGEWTHYTKAEVRRWWPLPGGV